VPSAPAAGDRAATTANGETPEADVARASGVGCGSPADESGAKGPTAALAHRHAAKKGRGTRLPGFTGAGPGRSTVWTLSLDRFDPDPAGRRASPDARETTRTRVAIVFRQRCPGGKSGARPALV